MLLFIKGKSPSVAKVHEVGPVALYHDALVVIAHAVELLPLFFGNKFIISRECMLKIVCRAGPLTQMRELSYQLSIFP